MEGKSEQYRRAGSDRDFTFPQRVKIRLVSWAFRLAINAIGATLRYEGAVDLKPRLMSGDVRIVALWHESLFPTIAFLRGIKAVMMASKSLDGEYVARTLRDMGGTVVRGSSTRGGAGALVSMIREVRGGIPAFLTVDGPRGPRRVVKVGTVGLAKKCGAAIVPVHFEADRSWTLRSWDRMRIPKPFSLVRIRVGDPVAVAPDASEESVGECLAQLQRRLDELSESGQELRESSKS